MNSKPAALRRRAVRFFTQLSILISMLGVWACGSGAPFSASAPPPTFAFKINPTDPRAFANYSGMSLQAQWNTDIWNNPNHSAAGSIYNFFGTYYWNRWNTVNGARWPAAWQFWSTDGCGVGSTVVVPVNQKIFELTCQPRPRPVGVIPGNYSSGSAPSQLTLQFDGGAGDTIDVWVVDPNASTVFVGPETRVIDGNLQVQVPAPTTPASYYVLAEGPNWFDGAHGTFEVSSGGSTPPPTMTGGDRLYPGQDVYSPNGAYRLTYQTDGNLVLYGPGGGAVWATMTFATPGYVEMQTDGNFVVYDAWGGAVWHTWTFGNSGAFLAVQDDGRVVVYSGGGSELWGS